jgi:hypothetical protein
VTLPSRVAALACVLAVHSLLPAQNTVPTEKSTNDPSVNQDSLTLQDFSKRLDQYVKLRKEAQAGLSPRKSGSSASEIRQYQASLAQAIRAARTQAKLGDVFSSPVAQLFRKLIAMPFEGGDAAKIRASLLHAEPVRGLNLRVNGEYPQVSALQSTPPTLLSDLPKLPPELEYRIMGRELVLLDSTANLIVDLLPDALPASQKGR